MTEGVARVTVGVAVRFETPDKLARYCRQLASAARHLDHIAESEVVFCLNGVPDELNSFLREQASALDSFELPFKVTISRPGKILAQRLIAMERTASGPLIFADADIEFDDDVFVKLYRTLEQNPTAFAAYAQVEPGGYSPNMLGRLQKGYYQRRHLLGQRRHLHGRCFILRGWLDAFCPEACDRSLTGPPDHLQLERGPLVDDIHYTRVLANCFGQDSIVMAPGACVRFNPPESWRELYRDSFRTEYELARLSMLFPEHDQATSNIRMSPVFASLRKGYLLGPLGATYRAIELAMRRRARHGIRHWRESPSSMRDPGHNHHG